MTGTVLLDRIALRADTPGCERVIHLNSAGASLVTRGVTQRMVQHLRLEEEMGGYEAADRVRDEWAAGKRGLATMLGTQPHNIAVVESTTVGFHRVLSTVPLRRGDRVLIASSEYASTVLPLLQLSRRIGLQVQFIPDDDDGSVDLSAFDRMLHEDVRLVCAVHAPSHNGLVNDVAGMGRIMAERDSTAWFVVDACQSIGQLPIDLAAIGCDFLVASGRKFLRGPRGTGVLAVSDRALRQLDSFPVDVSGAHWVHTDDFRIEESADRFETFERSIAAGLGLMEATRYALSIGVEAMAEGIGRHAEYLRSRLSAIPGWSVVDRGRRRSGIVTARHESLSAEGAAARLRQAGINGYVVAASMNPRELGGQAVLRLSPHIFNSQDELDQALSALA